MRGESLENMERGLLIEAVWTSKLCFFFIEKVSLTGGDLSPIGCSFFAIFGRDFHGIERR